jgi:hypothetical protein
MQQPTTSDESSSTSSPEEKRDWISLINESVHTYDDINIGDVYAVSRNFIVIKRGFVNVHYYYIPIKKVEGWDGNVLWLRITEEEVKEKYERDTIPDPNQYYVKYYPYYTGFTGYNYPLPVIVRRYPEPYQDVTRSPPEKIVPRVYRCGLCEENFNSESELDKHMDGVRH